MNTSHISSERDLDHAQAIIDCMNEMVAWHAEVRECSEPLCNEIREYLNNENYDLPTPRFTSQEVIQQISVLMDKHEKFQRVYKQLVNDHLVTTSHEDSSIVAKSIQMLINCHADLHPIFDTYLEIVKMYRENLLNPSPTIIKLHGARNRKIANFNALQKSFKSVI